MPPKKGERPQKTLRCVAHWLVKSNGGNPLSAARDLKRIARNESPQKLLKYVRRWGARSGSGSDVGEDMPRPGRRRKIATATDEQLAQWLIEDITVQGKKRRARTVHEVKPPCLVAGFPLCWQNLNAAVLRVPTFFAACRPANTIHNCQRFCRTRLLSPPATYGGQRNVAIPNCAPGWSP
jgi:hypothetical protein